MAGKKRVTRKQLLKEPDKVITMTGRAFAFFQEYKQQATVGVGIAVAVLLVATGIRFYLAKSEKEAFSMLDQAMQVYAGALDKGGAVEAMEASRDAFDRLLDQASGTRAGHLATLIFANICYQGGDASRAAGLYEAATRNFDGEPQLEGMAVSGLGYAYAASAEPDKALSHFERVADDPACVARDEALYQMGRLYELKGEREKSQQAFKRILSDHQGSLYADIAREKSSVLE